MAQCFQLKTVKGLDPEWTPWSAACWNPDTFEKPYHLWRQVISSSNWKPDMASLLGAVRNLLNWDTLNVLHRCHNGNRNATYRALLRADLVWRYVPETNKCEKLSTAGKENRAPRSRHRRNGSAKRGRSPSKPLTARENQPASNPAPAATAPEAGANGGKISVGNPPAGVGNEVNAVLQMAQERQAWRKMTDRYNEMENRIKYLSCVHSLFDHIERPDVRRMVREELMAVCGKLLIKYADYDVRNPAKKPRPVTEPAQSQPASQPTAVEPQKTTTTAEETAQGMDLIKGPPSPILTPIAQEVLEDVFSNTSESPVPFQGAKPNQAPPAPVAGTSGYETDMGSWNQQSLGYGYMTIGDMINDNE